MAADPLAQVRNDVALRVAEIRDAGPRLSPLDLNRQLVDLDQKLISVDSISRRAVALKAALKDAGD